MSKRITVYLHKTPGVNKVIAQGILEGIDEFLRLKLGLKPDYKSGGWGDIGKRKENHLNVFFTKSGITKSSINFEGRLSGNLIFRTQDLTDLRDYSDDKTSMENLKKLRGTILGYNELAGLMSMDCCNNEHCVFSLDKKNLDTFAFLLHLNKEVPLCDKHREWKL